MFHLQLRRPFGNVAAWRFAVTCLIIQLHLYCPCPAQDKVQFAQAMREAILKRNDARPAAGAVQFPVAERLRLGARRTLPQNRLQFMLMGGNVGVPYNVAELVQEAFTSEARTLVEKLIPACDLSDSQQRKLVLAAEADAKSILRTVVKLEAEFSELTVADRAAVQRAAVAVRDLNVAVEELQTGDDNLLKKVLSGLLTDEQEMRLVASHLMWFVDSAFAAEVTADERLALKQLLAKRAQELPPIIDQVEFCQMLIDQVSSEELKEVVNPEHALFFQIIENLRRTRRGAPAMPKR
ncbi:MAG: hypothetical protein R3C53_10905 [Pirellulaceae bacterium]